MIPGKEGVQAWNRYAYAQNDPIRYNDPTGHDAGCAGKDALECLPPAPPPNLTWVPKVYTLVAGLIQKVDVKLSKYVTTTIPVIIPIGLGAEHAGGQIIDYGIAHPSEVRIMGKAEGELPPLMAIGYVVTLAPAQIDDFNAKASISRHISDGLIDSGGFGASEGAGYLTLTGTVECGLCAPFLSVAANIGVSYAYDNRVAAWHWKDNLPGAIDYTSNVAWEFVKYSWEGPPVDPNSPQPGPVPTPP